MPSMAEPAHKDGQAAAEPAAAPQRATETPPAAPPDALRPAKPRRGLLARLIDLFGLGDDPERTKRRLLKNIAREVAKERPPYYMPRADAAGPGVAKLLHLFHCTLGPAQTLLESAGSSEVLRAMVIESKLAPAELELLGELTEEGIGALAEKCDPAHLAERIKSSLAQFSAAFSARAVAVDAHLRDFSVLLDLLAFDYHAALRRFDPSIPRTDFSYVPSFSPASAEYVVGELRDFAEILAGVDPAADWDSLFDALKEYRHVEAISRDAWRKLLRTIGRLGRANLLVNVVRLLEHDPRAQVTPRVSGKKAAEEYLEKVHMQAELALRKKLSQKKTAAISGMVVKTFGRVPDQRLTHYSAAANPAFEKRGAAGYTYAAPLNYLRVYLAEYLEAEVKSIADLLLVKGRWATPMSSHSLSDGLQAALKVAAQLTDFDESLAEDGTRGRKVKEAAAKAGRNKKEAYVLRQTLRTVNEAARGILGAGAEALGELATILRPLLDDAAAEDARLVLNWRDLDTMADSQLKSRLATAHGRLHSLIGLLAQYREVRTGPQEAADSAQDGPT